MAEKYTDFSELTTPMINEFIDKIIVHAPERIDGDRTQEVEIFLKFIGKFELPAPELTARGNQAAGAATPASHQKPGALSVD